MEEFQKKVGRISREEVRVLQSFHLNKKKILFGRKNDDNLKDFLLKNSKIKKIFKLFMKK